MKKLLAFITIAAMFAGCCRPVYIYRAAPYRIYDDPPRSALAPYTPVDTEPLSPRKPLIERLQEIRQARAKLDSVRNPWRTAPMTRRDSLLVGLREASRQVRAELDSIYRDKIEQLKAWP